MRTDCEAGDGEIGMLSGISICYLRIVSQALQRVTEKGY